MLADLLLKESLSDLDVIERLNITNTEIWNISNAAEFQPKTWTALSFAASEAD